MKPEHLIWHGIPEPDATKPAPSPEATTGAVGLNQKNLTG